MENKIELVKKELERRIKNLEELGSRDFIRTHFTEQYRFIEVYEGLIKFIDSLADIDEDALESDSVHINKAHEWIEHYIADAAGIDSSALIESFDNFVKNGN